MLSFEVIDFEFDPEKVERIGGARFLAFSILHQGRSHNTAQQIVFLTNLVKLKEMPIEAG